MGEFRHLGNRERKKAFFRVRELANSLIYLNKKGNRYTLLLGWPFSVLDMTVSILYRVFHNISCSNRAFVFKLHNIVQ